MNFPIAKSICGAFLLATSLTSTASTFDITEAEYISGISVSFSQGSNSIAIFTQMGNAGYQMNARDRYVREMEEWIEYQEYADDYDYILAQNSDYNDNLAFAIVKNTVFGVDRNSDGVTDKWYYHSDFVQGSDWDNNGKIDLLENNTLLRYRGIELSL